MASRVIQDSDDEDDPLSCEARPPPPIVSPRREKHPGNSNWENNASAVNDGNMQNSAIDNQIQQEINSVGDIGVNFDDFLQSQSQDAQRRASLSSSQRREEKWISNGLGNGIARGCGSIAFMMSEIDMAQRRLFDDDVTHTGQQISSTATVPFTESELGYIHQQQQQQGLHGVDNGTPGYSEGYSQVQVPVLHPEWYNPDRNQWVENALNIEAAHNSISMFDRTQSDLSSNAYESALQGSSDQNDPLHETIQTEILNKTPIRSKSLQEAAFDSPHDTEPSSSLRSPKVSRSKSDNTAQWSAPQQSQTNATDELSIPVSVEIPVIQKKASKKKKSQLQPENDDDDELAAPSDLKNKSKWKETSRRSKSKEQTDDLNDAHQPIETNTSYPIPNKPKPINNTPHTRDPDHDEIRLIQLDAPKTQPQPQPPEPSNDQPITHFTEPPKPKQSRKEPKKRKLKRGKTTSVTLQKTYEPDVEDDVIWIDDRHHDPQHDCRPDSIPTPDSISTPVGEKETLAAVEIPMIGGDHDQGNPYPEPAPKKRGRKRKKTSEQPDSTKEESTEVNEHAPGQILSSVSVVVEKPANDNKQKLIPSTINETQPSSATAPSPGPEPEFEQEPTSNAPETPKKSNLTPNTSYQEQQSAADASTRTNNDDKGPSKHSPIAGTSKVPYRVGLSRRARIAPLLKIIRK